MVSSRWTPEQLKLGFHLYCQLPFGKLHSRNPEIIELARLIGRTPSAVAMKLVNFASLDPAITSSGRRGLGNATQADRDVWDEFHANWDGLVEQSASLRISLSGNDDAQESLITDALDAEQDFTGEIRIAPARQRIKQNFFRRAVLSSYGEKCCVSGVSDRRFLVASHIVAWSEDASIRLHPGNGLCLSAIHDKAFDSHLFSLTDDYRVVLSEQFKQTRDDFLRQIFWPVDGLQIRLPERFRPETEFLRRHRDRMLHQD